MLPDPVEGFVERFALALRCDLLKWRVTAVSAPGGFGKTTLLAEACRQLRKRGQVVAWLTVDEDDGPNALAAYLSLALSEAGVEILDSRVTSQDVELSDYRIRLLLHSIELLGEPCVLALDDVHRLRDPDSRALVNRLLQHGPPNLRLALAYRVLPAGIDLATPILERQGVAITTEELRFEKPDIARFFGSGLSRSELAELSESSQGWPIALCIHRNVREQEASPALAHEITLNWIEARLWRGLPAEDREFVLDIGLFEWITPELVDDVLGPGSARRIQSIAALTGLLRSVGGKSGTLSLHPLIRQYCAAKRFRDTPDRYRSIHGAMAQAMARWGHVLAGMRHATEAGNPQQVGQILIDAGGFRLWLKHGLTRLRQTNKLLTSDVLAAFPRLGLIRCMELTMRGEFEEAISAYVDLGVRTDGFTRNWDGSADPELALDHLCFRYVLGSCGCRPTDTVEHRNLVSQVRRLANGTNVERFLHGAAQYAMGEMANAAAKFEEALEWLRRARAAIADSWYLTMYADFQHGNIAMVQGRIANARKAYARSQRAAKAELLEDAGPSVLAEVLSTELCLERNKAAPLARRSHSVPMLAKSGAWLDVYVAASEAAIELALAEDGPDQAMTELDGIVAFAEYAGLQTFVRCLLALRVSMLAGVGRDADAERVWSSAGFPRSPVEIVDLENQSWREMEAISCAHVRLLTAQSRFDEARILAGALIGTCQERGLRRTHMRCLALAMVLEHRAGDPAGAARHLIDYLRLYAETDYVRSLIAEREVVLELLKRLEDGHLDGALADPAAEIARVLGKAPRQPVGDAGEAAPEFTPREYEILHRLEKWRDKEIANALHLSEDGVRYHNKKIFNKLGVRSRFEATHRARSMGILPAAGPVA